MEERGKNKKKPPGLTPPHKLRHRQTAAVEEFFFPRVSIFRASFSCVTPSWRTVMEIRRVSPPPILNLVEILLGVVNSMAQLPRPTGQP